MFIGPGLAPIGTRKLEGIPPGPRLGEEGDGVLNGVRPEGIGPVDALDEGPPRRFGGTGGAPWRLTVKAFNLAARSWGRAAPPLLERAGCGGAGRRAALMLPNGVEEKVMPVVTGGGAVTRVGSRGL